MRKFIIVVAVALFAGIHCVRAVELVIHETAIQKILEKRIFTPNNRKYLMGTPADKCLYAYLSNPDVSVADGRLFIRMHFFGSLATEIAGNCIGLASDFPVSMNAVPYYRDGILGFEDICVDEVSSNKEFNAYLDDFLKKELPRYLQRDLDAEIKAMLQRNRAKLAYTINIGHIDITNIRAEKKKLSMKVEFQLDLE